MQGLLEAAESKVTTSFTPDPICMRQVRRRIRPQPCCRSPAHGRRSTGAEMEEESELSAVPSPSSSQRVSITPSSQTPCGNRDKGTICKALCAGFPETTEPAVSLSEDIKTNECLETSGDCWQHKATNITDCKDAFLGKFCECQVVEGVKLVDDGYTHCQAIGGSKGGRYMKVGPLNPRCARMGPARPCQRAA